MNRTAHPVSIAYLDLVCGISGDMLLAALIDAGAPLEQVREALSGLAPGEWELEVERTRVQGLAATRVRVVGREKSGDEHAASPYPRLRQRLEAAHIDPAIKAPALAMLDAIARAEASVHDVQIEDVHFHEVGGLDTLVDLAGAVAALQLLGVSEVYATPVPWSHGFVKTAHGRLPVPAPATVELLAGLPVRGLDVEGETVTPTGAALCKYLVRSFGPPPSMTVQAVGVGTGTADFSPIPNILRAVIGQPAGHYDAGEEMIADAVVSLSANIDDMQPELFESAMSAAFEAGALDVWLEHILMKNNRPGVQINALAAPADASAVADALFAHTTTLGVRMARLDRLCLPREIVQVETAYGPIDVKLARLRGKVVSASPEYRQCARWAAEHGVSVREVYEAAWAAARRFIEGQ